MNVACQSTEHHQRKRFSQILAMEKPHREQCRLLRGFRYLDREPHIRHAASRSCRISSEWQRIRRWNVGCIGQPFENCRRCMYHAAQQLLDTTGYSSETKE